MNAYFQEELPKATPAVALSEQISRIESKSMFQETSNPAVNLISVVEYAELNNLCTQTVRKYVKGH